MRFVKKIKKTKKLRAFTMIELLVVMAIFAVVTATVMANYKTFGRKTLLKNLAYNTALALREAQVSGLTGRNTDISGGDYYASYGLHFDINTPKDYIFYKDYPTSGTQHKYDPGLNELIGSYHLNNNYKIMKLCVYPTASGNCSEATQLDITFKRPQPDAYIYTDSGGPYPQATIELGSSSDSFRVYVLVEAAGQISVVKDLNNI